jgi:hypothetical protein
MYGNTLVSWSNLVYFDGVKYWSIVLGSSMQQSKTNTESKWIVSYAFNSFCTFQAFTMITTTVTTQTNTKAEVIITAGPITTPGGEGLNKNKKIHIFFFIWHYFLFVKVHRFILIKWIKQNLWLFSPYYHKLTSLKLKR